MRHNGRSILAIAVIVALQLAICPAVCVADSPERSAEARAHADAGPEPASHALPPCHQAPRESPQEIPGDGDPPTACTSCSAATSLHHTVETVSQAPSLLHLVFLPAVDSAAAATGSTPLESDREPPPPRLYLLKSSFLI